MRVSVSVRQTSVTAIHKEWSSLQRFLLLLALLSLDTVAPPAVSFNK